jgi:hypothetical protein
MDSPDALRTDLARAAAAARPDLDWDKGLAALDTAIAAGAIATATGQTAAAKAASAAAPTLLSAVLKGALVAVVAIGVTAGGSAFLRGPEAASNSSQAQDAPAIAPSLKSSAAPPKSSPVESSESGLAPSTPVNDANADAERKSPPATPPRATSQVSALPVTAASASVGAPAKSALTREMDDLIQLRAVAASDPARAIALAEAGQREFPRGAFSEEREALLIAALARVGRSGEAKTRATHFLEAHPSSVFSERLKSLTGI